MLKMRINNIDRGAEINWDSVSKDYAQFRQGYPDQFYQELIDKGIGLPQQKILDLATGTGELAINFARNGATVTGVDISVNQIEEAKEISQASNLNVDFIVSPCESMPISSDKKFDVISASLCWPYFNQEKIYHEVKRLLREDGILFVSYLFWLATDPVVECTEKIMLKYNPNWSHAGFTGDINGFFNWDKQRYNVGETQSHSIHQEFSKESWIGRVRGHRAIGATLNQDKIANFISELSDQLREFPDILFIEHFIFYHIIKLL